MPNISTGINLDSNLLNLKEMNIKEVRPEFDFKSNVDIRMINSLISKYVL